MTPDLAHAFAGVALGHVTREYPNKLDHVLAGPQDARGPRDLHPVFYGSFDWHSCVHGYWMLAHLYRRFPGMPNAGAIRALFDAHLVPERIAGECAYLGSSLGAGVRAAVRLGLAAQAGGGTGVARDAGGAWLVGGAGTAGRGCSSRGSWRSCRWRPIRSGRGCIPTPPSRRGWRWITRTTALRALLTDTVRRWYAGDADCQAWEPGGDEFLSPALIEAECMRAALPEAEFRPWFAGFLPRVGQGLPASFVHARPRSATAATGRSRIWTG